MELILLLNYGNVIIIIYIIMKKAENNKILIITIDSNKICSIK